MAAKAGWAPGGAAAGGCTDGFGVGAVDGAVGLAGMAMAGGLTGSMGAGVEDVTVGGGACETGSMGLAGDGLGIFPASEPPSNGEVPVLMPEVPAAGLRT